MKYWPLPSTHPRSLPKPGERGSFWEDRGDRHHAGIDLYAPPGTPVTAIDDGQVLDVQVFTSPEVRSYWNVTYSILIRNSDDLVIRYAELGEAFVSPGQWVEAGEVIGSVGMVLALERIDDSAPEYIRGLKFAQIGAMLHLELHADVPETGPTYLGGNYFIADIPSRLLDPCPYLLETLQTPDSLRFRQPVP